MRDFQEHRFVAEGEPHIDGEPGDLIFKVDYELLKHFCCDVK